MEMTLEKKVITSLLEARQETTKHSENSEKIFIADFLASTTFKTRKIFAILSRTSRNIKKSNFYK
jgi:hypothetical protein